MRLGVVHHGRAKYRMAETIKIHGRSSFAAEVAFTDETKQPVDLSNKVLFFETANSGFRKRLAVSTKNPMNAVLRLSVTDVDKLPTKVTDFIIRDETVPGDETVLGSGSVQRIGWVVA